MSVKHLLGLDQLDLTDYQIMARIKSAYQENLDQIEFLNSDGTRIVIKLPQLDFTKMIDPWD